MVPVKELFRQLGIPEDYHRREVEIFNPKKPREIYWGMAKPQYNGFVAGCKAYDPEAQLTRHVKPSDNQYAWMERYTYDYAGKSPAAVVWDYLDVNTKEKGIYLFLPEGLPVLLKAREKETITYTIPDPLKKKWIWEVSKKEDRNPFYWQEYARVRRGLESKGIVYAAYQFAKERPNEVGVTNTSPNIIVREGNVNFVDWYDVYPEILQQAYGIEEFYPIAIDIE